MGNVKRAEISTRNSFKLYYPQIVVENSKKAVGEKKKKILN